MSWLVRMQIDAETAYSLGIRTSYDWHRRLWECFPNVPDARRDFLTRVDYLEGAFRVWVVGRRQPSRPAWCPVSAFSVKEITTAFFQHRFYVFDLRANPVRAIVQRGPKGDPLLGLTGKRRRGKRVPLVRTDDLRTWLRNKAEARCRDQAGRNVPGGFRVVEEWPLEITRPVDFHFGKEGRDAYHSGVQFRGTLEVTDRDRFVETYHAGIGGAKGFGFGLFLLAPITPDRDHQ